ncbi:Ail/Lom family outer membrane beta-barrel protein [uncultured Cedecea sp.]|uniref:Ail/Lom family outer membrane beta-barrel protein n=1 Tax=uncultured Cedecea sp. TaxID=988762 RepID=UPI002606834A|nr:Ail/Lom family outer membrane beta-barrel protein [uncultured Cedecea sp.]
MSRKVFIGCLLSSFVIVNANASTNNHSFSLGYSEGKVKDFKSISGMNAQYRYEWNSPVSFMSSFTYMKNNDSRKRNYPVCNKQIDLKYYTLLAGPAYRVNDYVSFYALAGVAYTKIQYTEARFHFLDKSEHNATSVAYGAGVVINPMQNLSVNIGYERTNSKSDDHISLNGVNIGAGFRF